MSIDPRILKRMQGDDSFLESQRSGSRRVKIENGQNWIVRFLPARMGKDGLWYARIAKHWLNKLPITCPRNTAADYGGDPDCACPVCELAEELNESTDEVISKLGYKTRAGTQFLTYCAVFEKNGVAQPMSEILNPYEFWHYRSTWEELKGFYLSGGRKCADSVLDYEKGNDFSINKTSKGLRLDKQDSAPIFDPGEKGYADWIKKLEAGMKTPKVTIPTHEQLQVFAAKVQEAVNIAAGGQGGRGYAGDDAPPRGRRSVGRGYDEEEVQSPRGARRPAPVEDEEDDIPFDTPSPRSAPRSSAPARRPAPEQGADEDATEEAVPNRQTASRSTALRRPAPADEEPVDDAETPPAPRRAAPAPAVRRVPEPADDDVADHDADPESSNDEPEEVAPPAPSRRALEPTARRAAVAPKAEPANAPQGDAEEDDPLPEDDTDPVPPAPKAAKADRAEASQDEVPPAVTRKGGQGSSIRDRIAKLRD